MLFTNLNLKPKTMKIISLILTLTGILFILASKYIGNISLQVVLIMILLFYLSNFKTTYSYLNTKEKNNNILIMLLLIAGIIKPQLTMILIGIVLLIITIPPYINIVKTKDYSDIIMIIVYGLGILLASYCIINSSAALNTVIIIIGMLLTIAGCLGIIEYIILKRATSNSDSLNQNDYLYNEATGFEGTDDL